MFHLYKSGDKFKIAHKLLKQLRNGINPSFPNYKLSNWRLFIIV